MIQSNKKEFVEVVDHFEHGVLVKRLVNGVETEILPREFNTYRHKEVMSYKEAKKMFGDYPELMDLYDQNKDSK